jgi:FkbM family methyltransferase
MSSNPLQHTPTGEVPAGRHPSFWSDSQTLATRRIAVYKHFLRPGELAFDVGANVGEVTRCLLGLGCRVVAVEPQATAAAYIPGEAEIVEAALGATIGEAPFYRIDTNAYLSTLRRDIADNAEAMNPSWAATEVTTHVLTLDWMIGQFGVPAFAKIDVEGYEVEVLRGLSRPLPAMSLEVHSFDRAKIGAVVAELERLGDYGLLYSPGETYELQPFPPHQYAWYGDIYATLRGSVDEELLMFDSRP